MKKEEDPSPKPQDAPKKEACEFNFSVCAQCGTTMNLVKTKWVCPKCHWIIGCCD